jgi:hypothetical protein
VKIDAGKMGIGPGPVRLSVGNSAWLWGQPGESAVTVFSLPDGRKNTEIPLRLKTFNSKQAEISRSPRRKQEWSLDQIGCDGETVVMEGRSLVGKSATELRFAILGVKSDQSFDSMSALVLSPNGEFARSPGVLIDLRDAKWSTKTMWRGKYTMLRRLSSQTMLQGVSPQGLFDGIGFDSSGRYLFRIDSTDPMNARLSVFDVRRFTPQGAPDASCLLPGAEVYELRGYVDISIPLIPDFLFSCAKIAKLGNLVAAKGRDGLENLPFPTSIRSFPILLNFPAKRVRDRHVVIQTAEKAEVDPFV